MTLPFKSSGSMIKRNFIRVVNDFYPDPGEARRRAMNTPFICRGGDKQGWGTAAYQPKGVKELIENRFQIRIKSWEGISTVSGAENGCFFSAFAKGKRLERAYVHYDRPASTIYNGPDTWVILIVYMTPGASFNAGTSMWQHRKTGLTCFPTRRDAYRLMIPIGELRGGLDRDAYKRRCWKEIDRVGNMYNRAVMFPGTVLHSATRHFGSNRRNGRIIQVFYFPIDPKSAF